MASHQVIYKDQNILSETHGLRMENSSQIDQYNGNGNETEMGGNWSLHPNLNASLAPEVPQAGVQLWYIVISVILMCLCTVAILINVRILVSTHWLRRPVSTTLFINLSLAAADSITAGLLATGLLINSLLPIGLGTAPAGPCLVLVIEAMRLSCILVTMIHLLAQACNHYLGILAPFKSRRWLTHKNVAVIAVSIWIIPFIFMFTYFSSLKGQGFQTSCEPEPTYGFYTKQRFRGVYSILIFIPLIAMFFIYCHISVIVKKHQAGRQRYTRHSRHGRDQEQRNAQQQFDRNLKAIWTTLLILMSYMVCLMPVIMSFALMCDNCAIKIDEVDAITKLIIGTTSNTLLIIKPLLNPLIYASRMQEIRAATRRMNESCCRKFYYPFLSATEQETVLASADGIPRKFSLMSRTSTRRNHYSLTSTQQLDNGCSTRSFKRRTEDLTTEL